MDPALLSVKEKLLKFEHLICSQNIIVTDKFKRSGALCNTNKYDTTVKITDMKCNVYDATVKVSDTTVKDVDRTVEISNTTVKVSDTSDTTSVTSDESGDTSDTSFDTSDTPCVANFTLFSADEETILRHTSENSSEMESMNQNLDLQLMSRCVQEVVLHNSYSPLIQPHVEELIYTEETYVKGLLLGIQNYGNIFMRKDLPEGLIDKKEILLCNIEDIAKFHRDRLLPMLQRYQQNPNQLFEQFHHFIDDNCFYRYVTYAIGQRNSFELYKEYTNYFQELRNEFGDKLGIINFLVLPIQRIGRYPLLLYSIFKTLYEKDNYWGRSIIALCCRLDKKMRDLLETTNKSMLLNDVVNFPLEFQIYDQSFLRKVNEFRISDYIWECNYNGNVFYFDKSIVYTENKENSLIYRGHCPCAQAFSHDDRKGFTLFMERDQQQASFETNNAIILETWLELVDRDSESKRSRMSVEVAEDALKNQTNWYL